MSVTVIAEIGTSHGGSLERAYDLIDAAHKASSDAVKMQCVYADEILHPLTGIVHLPSGDETLYDTFKRLEVPPSFFTKCACRAHSLGMKFIVSPFGLKSLEDVLNAGLDALKVASPELNHFPLLRAINDCRKKQQAASKVPIPIILSSGVSRLGDIEAAIDILGREGVTLLHCVTSYPAPACDYNVRLVETLHNIFGVPCGISDHSIDPVLVPALTVALGGVMIEKHITLSKESGGLDDKVALTAEQFTLMTRTVRQAETMIEHYGIERGSMEIIKQLKSEYGEEAVASTLGNGVKHLACSEEANYGRTNRSLHYMKNMKKGDVVSENTIASLRTEKVLSPGISPAYLDTVTGGILTRDVKSGDGVEWKDFISRK